MIWEYYPLVQRVTSVKQDAMAFRMRTADRSCVFSLHWDGNVKDEEVKVKAKELVAEHRIFCENLLKAKVQRPEADKDIGYGNYGKSPTLLERGSHH